MKRNVQCMDTLLLYVVGGIVVRILVDLLYIHIQIKYVDKLENVREDTVLEKIWNFGKIFSQNPQAQPASTESQNMLAQTNASLNSMEAKLQAALTQLQNLQHGLEAVRTFEARITRLENVHQVLQARVNSGEDTVTNDMEQMYQAIRSEIADLRASVPAKRASRKKGDTPVEGIPQLTVTSQETPVEPQQ